MRRYCCLLGYLAAGPISGPLVAGVVRHRRTAPVLAALYLATIPSAWWLLGMAAVAIARR